MEVSVPSNIYIYIQDCGMSGGAGTVTSHFSVPPGSSRTITLHTQGEKEGRFPVHFVEITDQAQIKIIGIQ